MRRWLTATHTHGPQQVNAIRYPQEVNCKSKWLGTKVSIEQRDDHANTRGGQGVESSDEIVVKELRLINTHYVGIARQPRNLVTVRRDSGPRTCPRMGHDLWPGMAVVDARLDEHTLRGATK